MKDRLKKEERVFELIKYPNGEVRWNKFYLGWEVRIKDKWYLIEKKLP